MKNYENEKLAKKAAILFNERLEKDSNIMISERKSIKPYSKKEFLYEYSAIELSSGQKYLSSIFLLEGGKEIEVKKGGVDEDFFYDLTVDEKIITKAKERELISSEVKISPKMNKFSISEKMKLCETITVCLSSEMKRKADVYFLADTTGSMSSELTAIKSGIGSIISSLNATGHDINYGVGNYKDFPTDVYAFQHQQNVTSNIGLVTSSVNTWTHNGGGDGPEGQLFALDQIAKNPIGWRPGAKKIIVWFGDAPGHDPICPSISGLGYAITETSVITALNAKSIEVLAISTKTFYGLDFDPNLYASNYGSCTPSGSSGQGTRIATQTGGNYFSNISASALVTTIISSITTSLSTITSLQLVPKGAIVPFVSSISPASYGPITLGTDQKYTFDVEFVGKEKCSDTIKVFNGSFDLVADGEVLTYKPVEISVLPCEEGCGCKLEKLEKILLEERKKKHFTLLGNQSKACRERKCCQILDMPEFQPCFSLHWGDSSKDILESHDTEVVYITAKNPYGNLRFSNLVIEEITISPNQVLPNGDKSFTVVPDKLICFESLKPCSESVRQFAIHLRNAIPRNYTIQVKYKICKVEVIGNHTGQDKFEVNVFDS